MLQAFRSIQVGPQAGEEVWLWCPVRLDREEYVCIIG